jgi:hypothetical protein
MTPAILWMAGKTTSNKSERIVTQSPIGAANGSRLLCICFPQYGKPHFTLAQSTFRSTDNHSGVLWILRQSHQKKRSSPLRPLVAYQLAILSVLIRFAAVLPLKMHSVTAIYERILLSESIICLTELYGYRVDRIASGAKGSPGKTARYFHQI